MNSLAQKMTTVEQELATEHGNFTLFALFLRENSPGLWDVIVSAPWIDEDREAGLNEVVAKVNSRLEKEELLMLSRIVIVEHNHPELEELNRSGFATSSNPIRNENLLGQDIKQAFFIPLKQAA
ncbi:hypothetical protein KFZ76_17560 [Methylovulum psychrotolerans]|uniref:hypothetical protein n=1 Tax=Methylovulum psychrotolerans TaxID=1704499 RepID=UPI001BFF9540|nr:hypothetical protein [Methylovulum psychrotolerans]MBT9099505.1 hypothetical protein [Methylovulum psychrotolerans]